MFLHPKVIWGKFDLKHIWNLMMMRMVMRTVMIYTKSFNTNRGSEETVLPRTRTRWLLQVSMKFSFASFEVRWQSKSGSHILLPITEQNHHHHQNSKCQQKIYQQQISKKLDIMLGSQRAEVAANKPLNIHDSSRSRSWRSEVVPGHRQKSSG